jgi:hypothetical protein
MAYGTLLAGAAYFARALRAAAPIRCNHAMQWPSSTRIQFTLQRKVTIVIIDLSFQDEGVIDLVSSESSSEAIIDLSRRPQKR